MSEIATKVKAIIVDKLGVDEKDVTLEASFEKEFDIQIPDEEAEKIVTVGDAVSFIENAQK